MSLCRFPSPRARSSHTPLSHPASGFLTTTRHGLRHVEDVIGMPWMFDICGGSFSLAALRSVVEWLRWVDATFSTYRDDSQISRLNRGELTREQLHADVRDVLDRCEQLRRETGGYFDIAAPYRASSAPTAGYGGPGSVEPSGLVKGWAIAGAALRLRDAGAQNFSVNAGGDALLCGHPEADDRWRVGIQHPRAAAGIALTLGLRDLAVATSGSYVRGNHIVDPHAEAAPTGLLSVTIVGPDVATADAYATAAYAMGAIRAGHFCAGLDGYDAVLIRDDDTVITTAGIDALRCG
ncbi:MAG TPA: FAD:protein FMN transferase [Solirubrobacteraceae bacterium]|nr:FAD:protein FMN transferase [Solirubrobacteraceae bacterium]